MAPSLPNRSDAAIGQQHRPLQNGGTAAQLRQQSDQKPARQPMEGRLMRRVAAAGFGYARVDRDGDGFVPSADLGVLRIVSTCRMVYRS